MASASTMIRKISIQQVKLGMFVQALDGPWLSHPFWKTKFMLSDPADLETLRRSQVAAVWIDSSKGLDVDESASVVQQPTEAPAAAGAVSMVLERRRVPAGAEIERAAALVNRSRQQVMTLFGEARLGKALDAEGCLSLVEDVASSVARNPSALISLARLKTKDDYTYMHSVAVCALMVSLARQLGLDEAATREAGLAGLLHDVGKMMMPTEVLNKPGQLTDDEFAVMRSHPVRGHEALKEGHAVPEAALEVCLHHHEKMDGSGYPHKLAGEQISLLSRMGAVCDVYDAITSNRPYKSAWDAAGSLQRMSQWPGHFDPRIFQAFVKCVGIYPVGTLVKLHSGRLAVVVDQHPTNLVAPAVKIFFSTKSQMPIPVELLDLASSNDRIVGRESPADWGFKNLDDFWTGADQR